MFNVKTVNFSNSKDCNTLEEAKNVAKKWCFEAVISFNGEPIIKFNSVNQTFAPIPRSIRKNQRFCVLEIELDKITNFASSAEGEVIRRENCFDTPEPIRNEDGLITSFLFFPILTVEKFQELHDKGYMVSES